jgi:hypothetical protein
LLCWIVMLDCYVGLEYYAASLPLFKKKRTSSGFCVTARRYVYGATRSNTTHFHCLCEEGVLMAGVSMDFQT